MIIRDVRGLEVLDSRGQPTVEVEIQLSDGAWGRAIVPAGASTGHAEACELRDADPDRYQGRGVLQAVDHVERIIAPHVVGLRADEQVELDARLCELDGTPNKARLGANAILGVSLAAAHAAAASLDVPLYRHLNRQWRDALADDRGASPAVDAIEPRMPLPMTNMISGGLHAGGNLDFQDFLISPIGASTYCQGLEWIVAATRALSRLLAEADYESRLLADEGGYGPRLKSNREALEFVVRAIEAAGLRPSVDVTIALDVAATHFYSASRYRLSATGDAQLTTDQMIDELAALVADFPIASIEDGLADEDWDGWQALTARLGDKVRLVGDDLFATNEARLDRGIGARVGNAVLIKVNQIGTLSETLRTMCRAAAAGYARIVSARSGETEDTTIADLAVATAADQIKIGAIQRGERLCKYNQLLRIERQLCAAAGGQIRR